MVLNGHIFRGRKPVHWSPSSRTALAEAELEYPEDHISKSIYAAFEVSAPSAALAPLVEGEEVRVAIWTTTPWTIPANLAVAVNGKLSYAVVGHAALPYKLVVAEELVGALRQRLSALPEGEELQAARPPPAFAAPLARRRLSRPRAHSIGAGAGVSSAGWLGAGHALASARPRPLSAGIYG